MLLEIIILILGIPSGYLIAYMARDELVIARRYFRILITLGVIFTIGFFIYGLETESLGSVFVVIIALVSLVKSNDKKWIKRKI